MFPREFFNPNMAEFLICFQVYRGPDQKYKPSGYHDPHHHGDYHDTYAAHGFFVKQPLNIHKHKYGYDHHH